MHDALIWLPEAADADADAGVAPYLAPWEHRLWATCVTAGCVALLAAVALAVAALP